MTHASAPTATDGLEELRLGYVVGRLDRVLRRELAQVLHTHDLSVPAYTALSVLHRRPGLSSAQMARRALVTPQATGEIVNALVKRRLVSRRADPEHGRRQQLRLTAKGVRTLDACEQEARALEERMLLGVPEAARDEFVGVLRTCVRNLGAGL